MANYTMLLGELLDRKLPIGLDKYPIFDEEYRPVLNNLICDYYRFYEIGHETVEQFRHQMDIRMRLIMPYYNKLYLSETFITGNPLYTVDVATRLKESAKSQGTDKGTTTAKGTTNNDSQSRAVTSETPQNILSGTGDYATGIADSTSKAVIGSDNTTVADSTSGSDMSRESESVNAGFSGPKGAALQAWRQAILNIDLMVIDELQPLFMQVLDSGDEFTRLEPNFSDNVFYSNNFYGRI